MKFIKRAILTAGVAASALAAAPSYATIYINNLGTGANVGTISSPSNDYVNAAGLVAVEGYYGAQLKLSGATALKIDFFGGEASLANNFNLSGCSVTHVGANDIAAGGGF